MLLLPDPLHSLMSESQDPSMPINGGYSLRTEDNHDREAARLQERHRHFIECLEQHGPNFSVGEWPILARELGWSTEEVQMHAYQYLTCLLEVDGDAAGPGNGNSRELMNGGTENEPGRSWSSSECLLFDSLIATYRTTNNPGESFDWDELVAAHLPGRTPRDIRRRYRQLYGTDNARFGQ